MNTPHGLPNRHSLRVIFSIPKKLESTESKEKWRSRKRNKGEVVIDIPKVEPTKRRFTLSKVAGGFTVTRGAEGAPVPDALEIAVAYDRRRGSPLKKYSASDFKFGEKPITVEAEGLIVEERALNRMVVKVTQAEFRLVVTGFDENRDLFVDVDVREEADNDPKA